MKTGKQAKRDGKTLFNICRINGGLDENRVRQTVGAVMAQKPRGYMAILSHFHRLVRLDIERRTALVESTVAVSDSLAQAVNANLVKRYGQGLDVHFAVDPSLIGGLRIKVGSDVFDGSVKARLAELAATM